jgi:hypothetical protein
MVGWVRSNAAVRSHTHADQGHQPQPHRVAERAEHLRQPRGRGFPDWLTDERNAALSSGGTCVVGRDDGQLASLNRHGSILTPVDAAWQAGYSCIDCHL